MRKNIVALLESMWGWGGYNKAGEDAPRHFRINPNNFSGRRLYRICSGTNHSLLVTNCCRTVQSSANHHGKPDPEWVRENLTFLRSQGMDLLLVCGRVAHDTFAKVCQMRTLSAGTIGYVGITHDDPSRVKYIAMDHPAARRWSNASLDAMTERIKEALAPKRPCCPSCGGDLRLVGTVFECASCPYARPGRFA